MAMNDVHATGGKAALVVGASGVTGTPLAEQLLELPEWKVYGVSRRRPELRPGTNQAAFTHVAVDLTDPRATQRVLGAHDDITHVFYCANEGRKEVRLAMITNVLDALESLAPNLANINLLQGTKYYGCHLGPFKTPAKESDPRVPGADFYYSEEDLVQQRQKGKRWTWTAVRPHAVCGYAAGNPMNLATVIAIYGSLLRELGRPFAFPASEKCFGTLFQTADSEMLARGAIWVSTRPQCGNQAFNLNNGDYFRWKNIWPALADFFKLESAGPQPYLMAEFLSDKEPLWDAMTKKYNLKPFPFARAPGWAQGDYTPPHSRIASEYDNISDMVKIRREGFCESLDSEQMFLRLFARYRDERVIP
jgi:nucleoside-diphosphate-sugar epimerase